MLICQHCNKECKNLNSLRNHERLCPSNENRHYVSHTLGKTAWNKGKTKHSDPIVAQYASSIKENYSTGQVSLVGAATWDKEKRSQVAKSKGCGGYRPNAGHSQKYKVTDSYGNEVTLQSSYELLCSQILDNLKIKWIRPKSLKYDSKRYFPDFYLPEHDLYLDPKNDYLAKLDQQKIACVKEQNSVEVIILTKELLNEDYIKNLVL